MKGFFTKGRVALIVALIALIVLIKFSGLTAFLTLGQLRAHRDLLLGEVSAHYVLSVVLYIALYIVVAALSIPGGAVLDLAGGFLFGTVRATVFVSAGATLGATGAFLITRYLIGDWMHNKYGGHLKRFNDEIDRNGIYYLLTVRFIPAFPFFLINILAGLTRVPLRSFLWTTAVGILPGAAAYTFAGSQLGTINSPGDILSANIIAAFIVLALLSLVPAIVNHFRKRGQPSP